MIADLCEIDVVVTHGPEGVRSGKDYQLVHPHARLSNGFHWANRNCPNQTAWSKLSDGLDGYEKGRAGGDPIIHQDDDAVGDCGEVPTLAVEILPSSDLSLLCLNRRLDVELRKTVRCHGIMVQIDPSCFTHCAECILGVLRRPQLTGNEQVEWKMQSQAQLVPDGHPTPWKCHDDGCWVIAVLDQPVDESSTGLFAILERHALPFHPVDSRVYIRPLVTPTPIRNIAMKIRMSISNT